jgi:hypothetical protein
LAAVDGRDPLPVRLCLTPNRLTLCYCGLIVTGGLRLLHWGWYDHRQMVVLTL